MTAPARTGTSRGYRSRGQDAAGAVTAIRHRRNDFAPAAWCGYLATLTAFDEDGAVRVNGARLSDTQSRAVYRWMREGAAPTIWGADRFLVGVGRVGGLDEYLHWCAVHDLCPWATGQEPGWHQQPVDWAVVDRTWPDPDAAAHEDARAA